MSRDSSMMEIKFVGSGGQGAVVAAKLLALAGAKAGYLCQSFASYGALRRGGQVESFVRFSRGELHLHSKMYKPDYLILMDEEFAKDPVQAGGVKHDGVVFINTPRRAGEYPQFKGRGVFTLDARRIAFECGLTLPSGLPVVNTPILGGVLGFIPGIEIDHLIQSLSEEKIPAMEKSTQAIRTAYEKIRNFSTEEAPVGDGAMPVPDQRFPAFGKDCNLCELCYIYCPDMAISFDPVTHSFVLDRRACKGCGICIQECPRKALQWEAS